MGYSLTHEQSLSGALIRIKKKCPDLIVIDNTFAPKLSKSRDFLQLAGGIPKLILTDRTNIKDSSLWMKDGSAYPADCNITGKEFNSWTSKIIKNKNLELDNRFLSRELMTKAKEVGFFERTTRIFNSAYGLDKSLDSIMKKAVEMTGARTWTILLNDAALLEANPIRSSKKIRRLAFDSRRSIAGLVMKNKTPLIVRNVQEDKRFNKKVDKYANLKLKSLLCVPLIMNKNVAGVTELINRKTEGHFTEEDLNILVIASHYIAMTIKRTMLYYRIEEISITDDLTSLYNIRYLGRAIDIEIERAKRYRSMFSVIFMDIDYFKRVNDESGHLVGSRVLIELSLILQDNLRKMDVVARYGGDEFVIILPQTPRESSFRVAERLRKIMAKHVFLKDEGLSIKLTGSFGVASYPENAKSKENLLRMADNAMYRGKFLSKNTVFAAK
jgi:diguanylate cyclase (GGDEF)-like protein